MVLFLFCILVDRSLGGGYRPPLPPGYATVPHQVTKYRFDSASLCVGFEGITCFDALVVDLEEVAVFFLVI